MKLAREAVDVLRNSNNTVFHLAKRFPNRGRWIQQLQLESSDVDRNHRQTLHQIIMELPRQAAALLLLSVNQSARKPSEITFILSQLPFALTQGPFRLPAGKRIGKYLRHQFKLLHDCLRPLSFFPQDRKGQQAKYLPLLPTANGTTTTDLVP